MTTKFFISEPSVRININDYPSKVTSISVISDDFNTTYFEAVHDTIFDVLYLFNELGRRGYICVAYSVTF